MLQSILDLIGGNKDAEKRPPQKPLPAGSQLYCGPESSRPEGWLRWSESAPADLVCESWRMAEHASELAAVRVDHVLETLSVSTAMGMLSACYRSLAVTGTVEIHARMDAETLQFLVQRMGFSECELTRKDGGEASITAVKRVNHGERQVAPTAGAVRPDHRCRYELAATMIPDDANVLDAACGIGYGAWILSTQSPATKITAVDLSESAIKYGREHYQTSKIQFRLGNVLEDEWPDESFDAAVSFETIEHIAEDAAFLKRVYAALKPGGLFFGSTPNEDVTPFDAERYCFHVRHYTPAELESLLKEAGFTIEKRLTQTDRHSSKFSDGWHGLFNIAVARKA